VPSGRCLECRKAGATVAVPTRGQGDVSVKVPAAQMNDYGPATFEIGVNTLGGASSGASFNGQLGDVQVDGRALSAVGNSGDLCPLGG
jgi:hypothetical protein